MKIENKESIRDKFFNKLIDNINDPKVNKDGVKTVMKNYFNYIDKEKNMKEKKYDGTVYKKINDDCTEEVSHVELNKKKKKQIEILENVPEELQNSNAKILLE